MKIGVIGLGNMGSAIALRLHDQGFNVYVWNRTKSKADQIARGRRIFVEETIRKLIEDTEAAIVMVSDDRAFREIFYAPQGILESVREEYIIVNSSTTTPMLSIELWEKLRSRKAYLIEAPVLGGPNAARRGELIILVSGPKRITLKLNEVFKALGELVYISEKIGNAMVVKLAFNALLISNLQLLSEVLGLVESWDIDTNILKQVLDKTVFKPLVDKYYTRLLSEEYPVSFKLMLAAKDLEYARRTAEEKYQPTPIISTAATTYRIASLYGFGGEDYSRISLFLRRRRKWPMPRESIQ